MSEPEEGELSIRQMREELIRLRQENELLRQKLDALARRLFGKRSEQLDANQLLLLLQEAEAPGPAVGGVNSMPCRSSRRCPPASWSVAW